MLGVVGGTVLGVVGGAVLGVDVVGGAVLGVGGALLGVVGGAVLGVVDGVSSLGVTSAQFGIISIFSHPTTKTCKL